MWNSRNRILIDTDGDDVAFLSGSGESRNGLYGNSTGKRDLYERGHVATCSRGQAIALTVFIFSSIFFTSLAIAFVRPFTLEETFSKISTSYLDLPHCADNGLESHSDLHSADPLNSKDEDSIKYFIEGVPLATSCNDKPCEFEEEFPWNNVRLPTFIKPIRYDIELTPNLTTLVVKGIEKLIFKVSEPTYHIVFHSRNVSITSRTINERLKVVRMLEFTPRDQVYLETDEQMTPDITYAIRLKFEYKLSNQLAGFYLSKYKDKNGNEGRLATSHFEPTYARRAFPCFDEPHLKAKFLMTITHDRNLVAFFNTPKKGSSSEVRGRPNQIREEFEETVEMSTYLVAFVVCDFVKISDVSKNKVNVSVIASKDKISQAEFALGAATKLMDYYTDFFGIPFPLQKQDLIAIPDFAAGAMENWGLITYRETSLLYSEEETSVDAKQWIGVVIAHELAHQWFGNLVTMSWWNDLWLNEGFASFMEYRGVDYIQPDWKMRDQFFVDVVVPALELDSLTTSHPVSVEVKDPKEIEAIFDAISYKKGASIMHMLESTVGEEVLKTGLSQYLKSHKFGNAVTNDLWQAISDAWEAFKKDRLSNNSSSGGGNNTTNAISKTSNLFSTSDSMIIDYDFTVKELMDTWTLQTGYPIVTFSQQNDTNIYTIDQQRFLSAYKLNNSLINSRIGVEDRNRKKFEDYKWIIPFSYESNLKEFKETFVLNRTHSLEVEFPADMTWFKANVNGTGFYRVNYPRDNWDALTQTLIKDHTTFSALDRAQLISDAFALSRAGLLDATVPLEMLLYLPKEREYAPWSAAVRQLKQWRSIFEDTNIIRRLDALIQHLITPLYNELGWTDTGNHKEKLLRRLILSLAVNTRMKEAEQKAEQLYLDYKHNGHQVPPNFRAFCYCTGVRLGQNEDWNFAYKMYNETIVASERGLWMRALSATPHLHVLQQYLYAALHTDKIRSQDVRSVFAGVSANPAGSQLVWRQLQRYWPTIVTKFGEGSFTIGSIIQSTIGHFSNDFDYKAVQRFFRGKRKDVGSGLRSLDQAIEQILINIQWKNSNEETIRNWITNKIRDPVENVLSADPVIFQ